MSRRLGVSQSTVSELETGRTTPNIVTLERQPVRPGSGDRPQLPPPPAGSGYRWNWDTPIVVSHYDPKVWYMGAQNLFRSSDRGSIFLPGSTRNMKSDFPA